jgi:hypothetical protein
VTEPLAKSLTPHRVSLLLVSPSNTKEIKDVLSFFTNWCISFPVENISSTHNRPGLDAGFTAWSKRRLVWAAKAGQVSQADALAQ